MKKSFDEALALLQEATEQTITAQLLEVNRAIQNADKTEIMAIYYTVEATKVAVLEKQGISPSYSQLEQLYKSVIGRITILISETKGGCPYRQDTYRIFNSAIGYHREFEQALGKD